MRQSTLLLAGVVAALCVAIPGASGQARSTNGDGRPPPDAPETCRLWGWGRNTNSELLQPLAANKAHYTAPVELQGAVLGGLNVTDIRSIQGGATGSAAGIAVTFSGDLWAWGNNVNGFMGVSSPGGLVTTATKLPVPKASGSKVLNAQLGCKGSHWQTKTIFCRLWVLTDDGKLYTTYPKPPGASSSAANPASPRRGLAKSPNSKPAKPRPSASPAPVQTWVEATAFDWGASKIVRIQAGSFFLVVLTDDGRVLQILSDYSLVAGLPAGRSKPRAVANIPPGSVIKDLIAGEAFAMAVLTNGVVYGWGAGTNGQLCRASGYASLTNNIKSAPIVSKGVLMAGGCASEDYVALLSTVGDIYLCGERNRFQNGGINHDGRDSDILRLLAGQRVNRMACGESHIIVGTEDGRAFGWGADGVGQAGSATAVSVTFGWAGLGQPITQLAFPAGSGKVVDVGAGFFHGYALTCSPA